MLFRSFLIFSLVHTIQATAPPFGQLATSGNKLISVSKGQPVQLKGISLWWSVWESLWYNATTVQNLVKYWNINVIRAAMAVDHGGYLTSPDTEIQKVWTIVNAAINSGIYVIIDWHDSNATFHQNQSIQFFTNISATYGSYPHILYENNQPTTDPWNTSLKPYHEAVIAAIRKNDPNNVIIVGTGNYDQYVDDASVNPITEYSDGDAAVISGATPDQLGNSSVLTQSGQLVQSHLLNSSTTTTPAPATTTTTAPRVVVNPPYGRLAVKGANIISNATGQPVQLIGMSLFWDQWMPQFYNQTTINNLKCSWKSNIVRAAMGVDASGGYLSDPTTNTQLVYSVIDAAIAAGIYVIVDWHTSNATAYLNQSIAFFSSVSAKYGSYPHIIYEIFNEPLNVNWTTVLKPYHIAVIQAIRANDPYNVIVVGTPNWSQNVDQAAADPITNQTNIAYTLHYYAGTHHQSLRDIATQAINKSLPIFVTEYGTVNSDGNGPVNQSESQLWWNLLDQYKIGYLNWAIEDKNETAAALVSGTTAQQVGTNTTWTPSGAFVNAWYQTKSTNVTC
uniref:Glycoside hydrolase family 5 domain-containing protein n=1 Tax=Acrobeloides nanus TaxID=290746 RepID=A0A914DFZ8_9BILA